MLERLETELKLRGFSEKTVDSYVFHNKKFLEFSGKNPEDITEDDIRSYMAHMISDKKQKPSSINLVLSTLKFFYGKILEKEDLFNKITPPKLEKKIPTVLSKDEVKQLLASTKNRKHRLLLEMMYSSGLRVSEAVSVKLENLNLSEKIGKVVEGKGRKDRLFILSNQLIDHIERFLTWRDKNNIESEYLFHSNKDHSDHMSVRQAQKTIKSVAKNAGMTKRIFCHALRSSFATHLLESGVDIRVIQELLGHANLATTQRYTKVSTDQLKKIRSPLDNL